MPGLEVRRVPATDSLSFGRVIDQAFGNPATDEEAEATASECYDPDWAIGVYDAGRLVATTSADIFELTLPAGPGQALPLATVGGVTAVTVLPSHRRRGLLNQMMGHQLEQFRERGLPLAVLTASESVIYGRYGYGLASSSQSLAIATKRSGFLPTDDAAQGTTGQVRLVDAVEAAKVLPVVHDRARRLRPGEVPRSESRWARIMLDPERDRAGGSARTYVVHESPGGEPDGYASYRFHWKWGTGLAAHGVTVEDVYSMSPDVHAALWRFLLDIDLVEELTASLRPLDEQLRWRLADPRQLRTTSINDFLWARLVDVPAALSARGYGTETELVFDVAVPARGPAAGPDTGPEPGRYLLATSPAGGSCRRARDSERTDLVLGLCELGAIYLGGCPPSVLAAAGRIQEARPGALGRADAAFASTVAPFCGTHF